ncbi:MAG: TIM barrel protein [Saprospiraceae bacterium]|jgi:hydroxypyruvate isomerase|nr:TIM barrel protein [Saprospiraceae bacterium]
MPLSRRTFLKNSALVSTGIGITAEITIPSESLFIDKPYNMLFAPHFGMFENHAGKDLLDQIKYMHDRGFRAIEDNGMMGRTPEMQEKIGSLLGKLGMKMGVFVVAFDNWPLQSSMTTGKDEWKQKFTHTCKDAVDVAKRTGATFMTVVPGNYDRSLPIGIQTSHVIDTLRSGAAIFEPHNLVMVLEPLSDTPDLFLRYTDQTHMICKAVNSPACKILFDIYHMQKNEGRISRNIDLTWDEIAYFQIGDEPGRNEPNSGEINYKYLFKKIQDKSKAEGKNLILGMEHGKSQGGKEGELKLIQAYRDCDPK